MISTVLFWLAVAGLLVMTAGAWEMFWGNRSMHWLREMTPIDPAAAPRVSVIIAARDEAKHVEAATLSVLRQDYPNLEIVAVNDRSSDETPAILARLAQAHPNLRVVNIAELPAGWLGKCHALFRGAAEATGDWLLFMDGDVIMEPTTLRRAVGFLQASAFDHLAVAPRIAVPGLMLNMFVGTFTFLFGFYSRYWRARDPRSRCHIGIGAFNLVRASAYRAVGGHRPIAMRPDDDLMLGKLLKKSGYRQEMLIGNGLLTVEWYASVGELVRGLEKNAFAGLGYSLMAVMASTVMALLLYVWPFLALLVTGGITWGLNAAIVLLIGSLYIQSAGLLGMKRWQWIGFPLSVLIFFWIIWRATIKTLVNHGISWRGTHYSLTELRANRI